MIIRSQLGDINILLLMCSKLLTKTIGLSVPSWTPKWIDYKQLKKLLHPLEDGKRVPHDENSSSTRGLQHGDALASLLGMLPMG